MGINTNKIIYKNYCYDINPIDQAKIHLEKTLKIDIQRYSKYYRLMKEKNKRNPCIFKDSSILIKMRRKGLEPSQDNSH